MAVAEQTRKKRVFIAATRIDGGTLHKAIARSGLDAVTLEEGGLPGTTWVDSLHRCVNDADMVLGIMGDRRRDTNVFFELGVASALNKPTLLLISPDYPNDLVPPSGIPYLRTDLANEEAILFGLNQMLSIAPRDQHAASTRGAQTHAIGPFADELLVKLRDPALTALGLEEIVFAAIKTSGVPTIARGNQTRDAGVDFAVWSNDLEPSITNPLLIQCKLNLRSQADLNEVIGRMFRGLDVIPNGCGLFIYREGVPNAARAVPKSLPVVFVSADAFLTGLRDTPFGTYVRNLRNTAANGF